MRTLRLPLRLLWIPSIALGCNGVMPHRASVAPEVNTIAWVGDKPMPVVSGVPGNTVSSGTAEPSRPDDKDSRISGRVFDVRGNPVPNARVRLAIRGESGGRIVRATTDQSGGFTLHGLRPGSSYTLIAETDDRDGVLTGRAQAQVPSTQVKIKLSDLQDAPTARLPGSISTVGRASDEANSDSDPPATSPSPRRINSEDLPPAPEAEAIAPAAQATRTRRGVARLSAPVPGSRWHRGDAEDNATEGAGADGSSIAERSAPTTEAVANSADERTPRTGPSAESVSDTGPRSTPASLPVRRSEPRASASGESESPSAAPSKPAREAEPGLPAPAAPADDDDGPNPLPPAIEPGKAQAPREPASSPSDSSQPSGSGTSSPGESVLPAPSASSSPASPSDSSPASSSEAGETTSGAPAAEPLPPATAPQGDSAALAPSAADDPLADLTSSPPPSTRVVAKPPAPVPAPVPVPQVRPIAYDPFTLKGAASFDFSSNNTDVNHAGAEAVAPATSNAAPQASKRQTWGDLTSKHPELAVAIPVATVTGPRSAIGLGRRDPATVQPLALGTRAPNSASAPSVKDAGTFKATCSYDARHRQLVDFLLPDLQGQPVRFQDLNADFVLMDFWGTWCGYCMQSIPHLVALQQQLGPDKLKVVGIAYEQGPIANRISAVRDVSQRLGVNYQLLLGAIDGPCPLQDAFHVQAFPTMVLVDRAGRVLWQGTGATPSTLDRLDNALASATKVDSVRR